MAEQAELAFIKSFSSNLATLPLQYPDDYAQPPQNSLKRVPVLQVRCAAFARLHDLTLRLQSRGSSISRRPLNGLNQRHRLRPVRTILATIGALV